LLLIVPCVFLRAAIQPGHTLPIAPPHTTYFGTVFQNMLRITSGLGGVIAHLPRLTVRFYCRPIRCSDSWRVHDIHPVDILHRYHTVHIDLQSFPTSRRTATLSFRTSTSTLSQRVTTQASGGKRKLTATGILRAATFSVRLTN
jgi:hypothetical protein